MTTDTTDTTDEFIAATRFDLATALRLARSVAPGLTVNGRTAAGIAIERTSRPDVAEPISQATPSPPGSWSTAQVAETSAPTVTDTDGRLAVTWPHGRGTFLVTPGVVEEWVRQVNHLRVERDAARAEVEMLRGMVVWERCTGCGREYAYPHLCREHMLCGLCHPGTEEDQG